ncbi:MAG: hypothetical protein JNL83_16365 [Myxococcales bacterium]|nr:hypothetical protein [Myxococcales bacterium]
MSGIPAGVTPRIYDITATVTYASWGVPASPFTEAVWSLMIGLSRPLRTPRPH